MLEGLSPARRRFVVGLAVLALVAAVGVGAAVWANRDEAVRPVSQESQGPVLLVPGFNGGTTALEVLADALRSQGRSVVIVDLPGDNTGDLDEQARALDKAVVLQMQRDGARSVDVVGYSAGGVVARLWVARPRRRQPGPPDRHDRLAPPRHRPGGTGRRRRPGLVPRGVPAAAARQRAAPRAQRRRRDAHRTRLGVDLDDRRPGRGAAVVRPTSRARSTSPSSRSAPASRSPTATCPATPAVIAAVSRELAVAGPRRPRAATISLVLDVLGREVRPARAEEHHTYTRLQQRSRARRRARGSGRGTGPRTPASSASAGTAASESAASRVSSSVEAMSTAIVPSAAPSGDCRRPSRGTARSRRRRACRASRTPAPGTSARSAAACESDVPETLVVCPMLAVAEQQHADDVRRGGDDRRASGARTPSR